MAAKYDTIFMFYFQLKLEPFGALNPVKNPTNN